MGLSIAASAQLVSNLEETNDIAAPVTATNFRSTAFTTGSNSGGYTLVSATIAIDNVSGAPGDLVVGIHSASGSDPGALLEDLAGANPGAGGNHTFTSAGITLDANTTYHVQLNSVGVSGSYVTDHTSSDGQTSSDGWTIADSHRFSSNSGASWNDGGGVALQFSIQATPVPEPHEYAMFVGLGLMGFVAARRRLVSKALA